MSSCFAAGSAVTFDSLQRLEYLMGAFGFQTRFTLTPLQRSGTFIAPRIIRKNIASREWLRHFREAETFKAVTGYKHLVRTGRKLITTAANRKIAGLTRFWCGLTLAVLR